MGIATLNPSYELRALKMKKTINTNVVGLKHYGFSAQVITELQSGYKLTLYEDPMNPHDKNAVSVHVLAKHIGYISRVDAPIISAALKNKTSAISINLVDTASKIMPDNANFPVSIVIEREGEPQSSWSIPNGECAGIYCLQSADKKSNYIGQSKNVNKRLKQHCRDLFLGIHANYKLQRIYFSKAPNCIEATLLEAAPTNSSVAETEAWLNDRELHWIAKYKEAGCCLNIKPGVEIKKPANPLTIKINEAQENYKSQLKQAELLKTETAETKERIFTLEKLTKGQSLLMTILLGRESEQSKIHTKLLLLDARKKLENLREKQKSLFMLIRSSENEIKSLTEKLKNTP